MEGGEARSVEEAIAVLSVASDAAPAVDRHPEKRMKAAYEDFEKVGPSVLLMHWFSSGFRPLLTVLSVISGLCPKFLFSCLQSTG